MTKLLSASFYTRTIGLLAWVEAFGILFILLTAILLQYYLHEIPCPLCLLQRIGMLLIAVSLSFNLRIKRRIVHYMMANMAALLTAIMSLRQILLHINDPIGQGYGDILLGYHLYTWVFIITLLIIVYNSVVCCFSAQYSHESLYFQGKGGKYIVGGLLCLLIVVAIINACGVYFECGLSQCPANPVVYKDFTVIHRCEALLHDFS